MQTTLSTSTDIPTALPDIEADEDREKLLLEDQTNPPDEEPYADDFAPIDASKSPRSRAGKIVKGIAGFIVFLFLMGAAITWFFGMMVLRLASQSVNRTASGCHFRTDDRGRKLQGRSDNGRFERTQPNRGSGIQFGLRCRDR